MWNNIYVAPCFKLFFELICVTLVVLQFYYCSRHGKYTAFHSKHRYRKLLGFSFFIFKELK